MSTSRPHNADTLDSVVDVITATATTFNSDAGAHATIDAVVGVVADPELAFDVARLLSGRLLNHNEKERAAIRAKSIWLRQQHVETTRCWAAAAAATARGENIKRAKLLKRRRRSRAHRRRIAQYKAITALLLEFAPTHFDRRQVLADVNQRRTAGPVNRPVNRRRAAQRRRRATRTTLVRAEAHARMQPADPTLAEPATSSPEVAVRDPTLVSPPLERAPVDKPTEQQPPPPIPQPYEPSSWPAPSPTATPDPTPMTPDVGWRARHPLAAAAVLDVSANNNAAAPGVVNVVARAPGTPALGASTFYAVSGIAPDGSNLLGVIKDDWPRAEAATKNVKSSYCISARTEFDACVHLGTYFRNLLHTRDHELFFDMSNTDHRSARLLPVCLQRRRADGTVPGNHELQLRYESCNETWDLGHSDEWIDVALRAIFPASASTPVMRPRGPSSEGATGAAPPPCEPADPLPSAHSKHKKSRFYAVSIGKACGVYRTWIGGAEHAVTGVKDAKHKSFVSIDDAVAFAGVPHFFATFGALPVRIDQHRLQAAPTPAPAASFESSTLLQPMRAGPPTADLLQAPPPRRAVWQSPPTPPASAVSTDNDAGEPIIKLERISDAEPTVKIELDNPAIGPDPLLLQDAAVPTAVIVVVDELDTTPRPPSHALAAVSTGGTLELPLLPDQAPAVPAPPPSAAPSSSSALPLVESPTSADAAAPTAVKIETTIDCDEAVPHARQYHDADALVATNEPAAVALPPPAHPHTAPLVPTGIDDVTDASPALPTPLAQPPSSSPQEPQLFTIRRENGECAVVSAMSSDELIERETASRPTMSGYSAYVLRYNPPGETHYRHVLAAGQRLPAAGTTFVVAPVPVAEPLATQEPPPIPCPYEPCHPTTAPRAVSDPTPSPHQSFIGGNASSRSASSSSSTNNELDNATSSSSSPSVSDDDSSEEDGGADDGASRDLPPSSPLAPPRTAADETLEHLRLLIRSARDETAAGEYPDGDVERDHTVSNLRTAYHRPRTTSGAPAATSGAQSLVVMSAPQAATSSAESTDYASARAYIVAVFAGALTRRRLSLERSDRSRARDTSSPPSTPPPSAGEPLVAPIPTPQPISPPTPQLPPTPPTPPVSGHVTPLPNAVPVHPARASPVSQPQPPAIMGAAPSTAATRLAPAPAAAAAAAAAAPTSRTIPLENASNPLDLSVRTKQEEALHYDVLRAISKCNKDAGSDGMNRMKRFVLLRNDTDGASHNPIVMMLVFGIMSQDHHITTVRGDTRSTTFRYFPYAVLEARHVETNTDLSASWPFFPCADEKQKWTYMAMTNDAESMEVRAAKAPRWRPTVFDNYDHVSVKLHRVIPPRFVSAFRARVATLLRQPGANGASYAQIRNQTNAGNYEESIKCRAELFHSFLNGPKSMIRALVGATHSRVQNSFLAAQLLEGPQEQATIIERIKQTVDENALLNATDAERVAAAIAAADAKAIRGATTACVNEQISRAARLLKQQGALDELTAEQRFAGLMDVHPRNTSGRHVLSSILVNAQREQGNVGPRMTSEALLSGNVKRSRTFAPPDPLAVRKFVQQGRRGAAPGGSGWTEEVLHQLLQTDIVIDDICAMLADIANNELREDVRRRIIASDLIALPKPLPSDYKPGDAKKVRPITLCEVLLKLACRLVINAESKALAKAFGDLQFGNRPLGVEICIHAAREQLRSFADAERTEPDKEPSVIILLDIKNAFNTLDRVAMYEALQQANVPMLLRLFEVEYASDSLLRIKGGAGQSITSQVGSRQGSTPAGICFALGMHQSLVETQSVPGATCRAFFDDTIIAGKLSAALPAFNKFCNVARARGLELNFSKCVVLCPDPRALTKKFPNFVAQLNIPQAKYVNVTTYLGASVGTSDDIEKVHLTKHLASGASREFERLAMMEDVCGCAILKQSVLNGGSFALRTHHPAVSIDAIQSIDQRTKKVVSAWTKCSVMSEDVRVRLHLPVKLGGLGITELQQTASAAYTASTEACRQALVRKTGDAAAPASRLQRQLTHDGNQALRTWHDDTFPAWKEHLARNSEPQTGAFITDTSQYAPSSAPFFIAALSHRAGIVPDNTSNTLKCPGCPLTFSKADWLNHAPRCVKVPGYNATMVHHSIVNHIRRLCTLHGVPVESSEPRMLWHFVCPGCKVEFTDRMRDAHTASCRQFIDKRCSAPICHGPDIHVHMADPNDPRSTSIVLDVTVVSILTDTAKKMSIDQALAIRTAKKSKDYTEAAAQMGAAFIVFDVTELGRPGPGAQRFLSLVARCSGADYHELLRSVASFTAIAHGHAIVNAQRLAGIACGSNIPANVLRSNGINIGTTASAIVSSLSEDAANRPAPWPADIARTIFAEAAAAAHAQSLNHAVAADAAASDVTQATQPPGATGTASSRPPALLIGGGTPGAAATPPPPLFPAPSQHGAAVGATASGAGPVRPPFPFPIVQQGVVVRATELPSSISLSELKQHLSQAANIISVASERGDGRGLEATFLCSSVADADAVVSRFDGVVFGSNGESLKLRREPTQQERLRRFELQREQLYNNEENQRRGILSERGLDEQALNTGFNMHREAIITAAGCQAAAQHGLDQQRAEMERRRQEREQQQKLHHEQREFIEGLLESGRWNLFNECNTSWTAIEVAWRDARDHRGSIRGRHLEHLRAAATERDKQQQALVEAQKNEQHEKFRHDRQCFTNSEAGGRQDLVNAHAAASRELNRGWPEARDAIAARDAERHRVCALQYAECMRQHAEAERGRVLRAQQQQQHGENSQHSDAAMPSTPIAAGIEAAAASSSSTPVTPRPSTTSVIISIVQPHLSPRSLATCGTASQEDDAAYVSEGGNVRIGGMRYMISSDLSKLTHWHPNTQIRTARATTFLASACVSNINDTMTTRSWSDFMNWALRNRFEVQKPGQVSTRLQEYAISLGATAEKDLGKATQFVLACASTNARIAALPAGSGSRAATPTSDALLPSTRLRGRESSVPNNTGEAEAAPHAGASSSTNQAALAPPHHNGSKPIDNGAATPTTTTAVQHLNSSVSNHQVPTSQIENLTLSRSMATSETASKTSSNQPPTLAAPVPAAVVASSPCTSSNGNDVPHV